MSRLRRTACELGPLLALCGLMFFDRLATRDLWSSHEARAAQQGQYLLDRPHFGVHRQFDHTPDLQKPPMYYWLVAGLGWLGGGVGPWAVRLPAALSATGCVFIVYGYLARKGRPTAGLIAGTILATSAHFVWLARTGRIDMPLTLAITAAVLAGGRLVPFALSAGVLLKGPIGLVLPVLVKIAAARRGFSLKALLVQGLIVLGLTLPWFWAANADTDGAFGREFFWHHHVARAAGTAPALATHPLPYYFLRWPIDVLPWSLVAVPAAFLVRRRWSIDPELRLGVIWMLVVTAVLTLSRFKRADYLLPAYPGFAIALACAVEHRLRPKLLAAVALSAVIGWQVALAVTIPRDDELLEKATFAAEVRRHCPAPGPIYLFRIEDHLLAWHLKPKLNTFREWDNLNTWVGRAGPHYILLPADLDDEWPVRLCSGTLEEVTRFVDRSGRKRSYILTRTRPHAHGPAESAARLPVENQP